MKASEVFDLLWMAWPSRSYLPGQRAHVPAYRVGEPLQRGRRTWPAGAQYTYGLGGHELTLFHDGIDDLLVHEVRFGEAEFVLLPHGPILLLAYRFGDSIPWSDAPFCWHLQPAHWRGLPPIESSPEDRALLWITLIGAGDGLIHAQRGMTLAPDFTRALHAEIRGQAARPFDPHECASAVSEILVPYPDAADRLHLARARTIGNQ